jgi:hypothetical protein
MIVPFHHGGRPASRHRQAAVGIAISFCRRTHHVGQTGKLTAAPADVSSLVLAADAAAATTLIDRPPIRRR